MKQKIHNIFKNTNNLAQNFIFVFALNVLQKISGLLIIIFLTRSLTKDQFGDYQYVFTIIGLLTIFSLPGFNELILQNIARGNIGIYRKSLKYFIFFSLIGSFILFLFGLWHQFIQKNNLYLGFYLSALFFPFLHNLKSWKSFFSGEKKFSLIFYIEATVSLLILLSIMFVSIFFPGSIILSLFFVMIFPSITNIILSIKLLKRTENLNIEEGSISYGFKTSLNLIFNIISNHLDKVLIYHIFSPSLLATFFLAERISEISKSLSQNLAATLAPRFAKKQYTPAIKKKLNFLISILGMIILIIAIFITPWFIKYFFNDDYLSIIPIAQALMVSVIIMNYSTIHSRFIFSKLDHQSHSKLVAYSAILRMLASCILIPIFGIWGAVFSTFIYRLYTSFMTSHIIKKKYLANSN